MVTRPRTARYEERVDNGAATPADTEYGLLAEQLQQSTRERKAVPKTIRQEGPHPQNRPQQEPSLLVEQALVVPNRPRTPHAPHARSPALIDSTVILSSPRPRSATAACTMNTNSLYLRVLQAVSGRRTRQNTVRRRHDDVLRTVREQRVRRGADGATRVDHVVDQNTDAALHITATTSCTVTWFSPRPCRAACARAIRN